MQRYFTSDKITEDTFLFQEEIFHHVKHVMRQKVGDEFLVVDGNSKTFLIEIISFAEASGKETGEKSFSRRKKNFRLKSLSPVAFLKEIN